MKEMIVSWLSINSNIPMNFHLLFMEIDRCEIESMREIKRFMNGSQRET